MREHPYNPHERTMRTYLNKLDTLAPMDDAEVASRVISGDVGAFELLMRRHNERLFRTARSVLSNDTDAQDVLQESYIRIFKGLPEFAERSRLVTWMTRIVFNEALRFRSRRAKQRLREQSVESYDQTTPRTRDSGQSMDSQERMQMFDDALDALSERERGVVMLRIVQGLSTRETAASLGMTESNVKVCLLRTKPKMAQALKGAGADEIRRKLAFDGERCDRMVSLVYKRLEAMTDEAY